MKPTRTWILVANARQARVFEHSGVGHGLHAVSGMEFEAKEPSEYSDRPGTGHSIAGPGSNAMDRASPKDQADLAFAKEVSAALADAVSQDKYDRLVIFAGPHMLGFLRKVRHPEVEDVLLSEIDKDLTNQTPDQIEKHLDGVFLV